VAGKGSLWGLGGSASIKDRTLTLTVVNPHASEPRETEIAVRGAQVTSARVRTLAADDVHAHNSFDRPTAVVPADAAAASARGGVIVHRFPPASVTRLTFDLAGA